MIRLFIALKIPEKIKDKIFGYCYDVSENPSGYQWEANEKIHLTLKFIGDIKDDLLPRIIGEIDFIKNYSSFDCQIYRFGFFFRDNEAKILWCNLETDGSIIDLVDELNERLSKYDIKVEKRKFKGHLTLLRIKRSVNEKFIQSFKEYKFDPIKFNTNQVALIQSVLKLSGSEYKVLKIYELK
ncbi:MAG: RNA 2',3'-cyclic phosphodiesterase [Ignavibacteria bacterium]|nr:RNA 2',3'-cyclic phosphodiesterase [Ignavibacteria bacterium]